jgi:predicted kinase
LGSATPIVLVTGPPASGKSYVAGAVADQLRLPLIAKDAIKETLFETLGTGDVAWSQRLGHATFALMLRALEAQLQAGRPVVVEANLAPDDARPALQALHDRMPLRPLELHCTAPDDLLLERYAARAGSRHPGHLDEQRVADIAAAVAAGRYRPLGLSPHLMIVDTTSFDAVDVDALARAAADHVR